MSGATALVGRPASFFGVLMSIQAAGSIIGGLAVGPLIRHAGEARTLGIALAAWAAASLIYMIPVLPAACAALAIFGVAVPLNAVRLVRIFGESSVRQAAVGARRVLGDFGLDLALQVDAGHLGEAEQVDGHVREFFADVLASRAPGLERFGDLSLEQAEFQRDIGRVEPLRDLVRPSSCLC